MKRVLIVVTAVGCFLIAGDVSALRMEKPQPFSRWDCPSFTRLNNTLSDIWNITNGRYNLDSITTDPNGNRNGTRGELVYSFFDSDEHICVNSSSPSPGTSWTCINLTTFGGICGSTSDTQVLFNDGGSCGGDNGFKYGKTVDHATLGPDAEIDKALSTYSFDAGALNSHILGLLNAKTQSSSDIETGLLYEFLVTPTAQPGLVDSVLHGSTVKYVVDGSAGTSPNQKIVDDPQMTAYNSLMQFSGSGTNDEYDGSSALRSFNSEFITSLTGTNANISPVSHTTFTDANTISIPNSTAADALTTASSIGMNRTATYTANDTGTISDTGWQNSVSITSLSGLGTLSFLGYAETLTVDSNEVGNSINNTTFNISHDYDVDEISTGGGSITDRGLNFVVSIQDGTVVGNFDAYASWFLSSAQTFGVDVASTLAGGTHQIYGWDAQQTIDLNADSGTMETMQGFKLRQVWNGDAGGTTVDGIYIEGFAKAGTGTVATATGINLVAPVRTAGSLTSAYTLKFTVPSTAASENYGLYAANGTTSGIIVMEGGTADAFETSLGVAEPTADNVITFPNETGTLATCGSSTTCAGVWSPTTNNIANLGSSSAAEGQYMRVGNTVTGSIQLTVDPTLTATSTQLELDLPVASDFGATSDAAGACGGSDIASETAEIRADATSNEIEVLWITNSAASHEISCSFSYQVI